MLVIRRCQFGFRFLITTTKHLNREFEQGILGESKSVERGKVWSDRRLPSASLRRAAEKTAQGVQAIGRFDLHVPGLGRGWGGGSPGCEEIFREKPSPGFQCLSAGTDSCAGAWPPGLSTYHLKSVRGALCPQVWWLERLDVGFKPRPQQNWV